MPGVLGTLRCLTAVRCQSVSRGPRREGERTHDLNLINTSSCCTALHSHIGRQYDNEERLHSAVEWFDLIGGTAGWAKTSHYAAKGPRPMTQTEYWQIFRECTAGSFDIVNMLWANFTYFTYFSAMCHPTRLSPGPPRQPGGRAEVFRIYFRSGVSRRLLNGPDLSIPASSLQDGCDLVTLGPPHTGAVVCTLLSVHA